LSLIGGQVDELERSFLHLLISPDEDRLEVILSLLGGSDGLVAGSEESSEVSEHLASHLLHSDGKSGSLFLLEGGDL